MKFNEMEAIVTFLSTTQGNDTPEWQAAINNLQALLDAMEPYETKDEEGNYPPISQEEYQRIDTLFDNTVASVNTFIKENNNNNDINDDIRIQLSKNLNKEFLSKAYIEFKNVKPIQIEVYMILWKTSVIKTSNSLMMTSIDSEAI